MSYKILVLPGDGIGPEIMQESVKVLQSIEKIHNKKLFEIEFADIGGIAIDNHNNPLPESTLNLAKKADAILLGAVGGYKWDHLSMDKRPEAGLLKIRKELDLFANIRPAKIFNELIDMSTLKKEVVEDLDIIIVRELTGGLYFGEPRGLIQKDSEDYAFNTMCYKKSEIERIGKIAFEIAQKRSKKLISIDKANVLICMKLWRDAMNELSGNYQDVQLSHSYVDAMAMELVKRPKNYDVIVTENMFGDILSDLASQLVGSIGLLPSASLGEINKETNKRFALYEPIHGSAPDIAGKNIANPIGTIMSATMMLRYSFNMNEEADLIENSIQKMLKIHRTADIWQEGLEKVGTKEIGEGILELLIRYLITPPHTLPQEP
jgi:3-isopropylmalate dehydrogenase